MFRVHEETVLYIRKDFMLWIKMHVPVLNSNPPFLFSHPCPLHFYLWPNLRSQQRKPATIFNANQNPPMRQVYGLGFWVSCKCSYWQTSWRFCFVFTGVCDLVWFWMDFRMSTNNNSFIYLFYSKKNPCKTVTFIFTLLHECNSCDLLWSFILVCVCCSRSVGLSALKHWSLTAHHFFLVVNP